MDNSKKIAISILIVVIFISAWIFFAGKPPADDQELQNMRGKIKSINPFISEIRVYASEVMSSQSQESDDKIANLMRTKRIKVDKETQLEKIIIELDENGKHLKSAVVEFDFNELKSDDNIIVNYQYENDGLISGVKKITLSVYGKVEEEIFDPTNIPAVPSDSGINIIAQFSFSTIENYDLEKEQITLAVAKDLNKFYDKEGQTILDKPFQPEQEVAVSFKDISAFFSKDLGETGKDSPLLKISKDQFINHLNKDSNKIITVILSFDKFPDVKEMLKPQALSIIFDESNNVDSQKDKSVENSVSFSFPSIDSFDLAKEEISLTVSDKMNKFYDYQQNVILDKPYLQYQKVVVSYDAQKFDKATLDSKNEKIQESKAITKEEFIAVLDKKDKIINVLLTFEGLPDIKETLKPQEIFILLSGADNKGVENQISFSSIDSFDLAKEEISLIVSDELNDFYDSQNNVVLGKPYMVNQLVAASYAIPNFFKAEIDQNNQNQNLDFEEISKEEFITFLNKKDKIINVLLTFEGLPDIKEKLIPKSITTIISK